MAITGGFGQVPAEWRRDQRDIELPHDGLHMLVLSVTINRGTAVTEILAVSYKKDLLEAALATWLRDPRNQAIYLRHRIEKKPLILE